MFCSASDVSLNYKNREFSRYESKVKTQSFNTLTSIYVRRDSYENISQNTV